MKETEDVYYVMFKGLYIHLIKNKSIWENNFVISDAVIQIGDTVSAMEFAKLRKMRSTKDFTEERKSLRKDNTPMAFQIKEMLRVYYRINNQSENMQLLEYPITYLKKLPENDFIMTVRRILETAVAKSAVLIPLGITPSMTAKVAESINKLYVLKPKKEFEDKSIHDQIVLTPVMIRNCRLMLKNILDSLIETYSQQFPDFCNKYKLLRKRRKRTGSHRKYKLAISGKLTDAVTGRPLADVVVIVGLKKIATVTDSKGNYTIKVYKKDATTIKFISSEYYNELTKDIPKTYKKDAVIINAELTTIYGRYEEMGKAVRGLGE